MKRKSESEANLIPGEMAARLIMVEQREFDRLVRGDWITPETRNPVRYRLVAVVQGHLRYLEHERTRGRTVAELAQHLGLSVKRINELIDRGIIERKPRGEYNLDEARLAYCEHIRATAAGRGAAGEGDATLAANRSRLVAAKADIAELDRAKASGGWAPIDLLIEKFGRAASVVRELILATPGTLAWQLEGQPRAKIFELLDDHLRGLLDELAEPGFIVSRMKTVASNEQPEARDDD